MAVNETLSHKNLRTPKAAAIAGIAFSLLLMTCFWLLRLSIPADPMEPGAWIATNGSRVAFALNLVPFCGVAFIWFIGVIRDRLGGREDRFFATVFLWSSLLFLAMLFVAAAATGAVVLITPTDANELITSPMFRFARALAYIMMNVYAIKMAAVFMITTSTIAFYTAFVARWIAYLGYALASILLVGMP